MNRIQYNADDMLQFFADAERTRVIDSEATADTTRDAEDRADRTTGLIAGKALKTGDDIEIYGGVYYARVIGGAPGDRNSVMTYRFDPANGGHVNGLFAEDAITDRAPADPLETPMVYDETLGRNVLPPA